jgi:predicted alpha/beta-hydrolase family hydrolase
LTAAIPFLVDGPPRPRLTVSLAHGAGAPMDSPFMESMAKAIAGAGIRVVRFEFPYMQARRVSRKKSAPDREPVLRATWWEVIRHFGGERLVIGGKSLGGRIASMVADEAGVRGLICFGYPFHPPGAPNRPRTAHLSGLSTPALFVQGTRDPFGSPEEIRGYHLSQSIRMVWAPDGDHSLKPRARSGRTETDNLSFASDAAKDFLSALREGDGS